MAQAKRDNNQVTTLIGVSSSDGVTPITVYVDPTTHRILTSAAGVGTPGGADTNVQYNDGGSFGGDANFTYDGAGTITLSTGIVIGSSNPFSDSAGTLTLQNVDALDATTEATIEAAIDTLANLTSIQGQTVTFTAGITVEATSVINQDLSTDSTTAQFADLTLTNDLLLASGSIINFDAGDVTLTHSANTLTLAGGSLVLPSAGLTVGASIPFSDSAGTLTLQNVDALDATTEATIEAAIDTLANLTSIQSQSVTFSGSLNVEGNSNINQDLTTDSTAAQFADLTLTNDLLLSSGSIINFNSGDVTITHSANTLTWAGASSGYQFDAAVAPSSNDGAALGTSALGWSDIYLATGARIYENNAAPKQTIVLTAAGGAPTTTAGCSSPTQVESTTNKVNYWVLDFDTTTEEHAFWNLQMPDNYDGGTLTAIFVWTNAGGGAAETVAWGIAGRAYADDDAIDQALGTEITTSDTWIAQNDVHISASSSAITLAGSPAGGQWVYIEVARKVASDDLTGDARLMSVKLEYGITSFGH